MGIQGIRTLLREHKGNLVENTQVRKNTGFWRIHMRSVLCKIPLCNRCLNICLPFCAPAESCSFYFIFCIFVMYFGRRKKFGSKKAILFYFFPTCFFIFFKSAVLMIFQQYTTDSTQNEYDIDRHCSNSTISVGVVLKCHQK